MGGEVAEVEQTATLFFIKGQTLYYVSKVFVIRHAEHSVGESNPKASLSYPCATEHDGKLYVGFSNNGGRKGNLNSAEMAVIPSG